MYIVLMDGPDPRFLGGSARARNARVAERGGASMWAGSTQPAAVAEPVLLVPANTALMTSLFRDARFAEALRGSLPVWLHAEGGGGSALICAAEDVTEFSRDQALLRTVPRVEIGHGTLLEIGTREARRDATRIALVATGKATDGWVSRTFNRPVSRACSTVALAFGMSATAASLVTLLVGLLCAWTAAQPGYVPFVVTGVLFQLASMLDGVDGEIARATLTESAAGARVDTIVDQVTYVTCFAGLIVGWAREGSGVLAVTFAGLTGVVLVMSLLRAGRFVSRHADNASFVFIDRAVRRAADDSGHLALRMAAGSFALLRRDLFAVIFLGVSLTGFRVAVPGLILIGVVIANLTFSLYDRELSAAAADLKVRGYVM